MSSPATGIEHHLLGDTAVPAEAMMGYDRGSALAAEAFSIRRP